MKCTPSQELFYFLRATRCRYTCFVWSPHTHRLLGPAQIEKASNLFYTNWSQLNLNSETITVTVKSDGCSDHWGVMFKNIKAYLCIYFLQSILLIYFNFKKIWIQHKKLWITSLLIYNKLWIATSLSGSFFRSRVSDMWPVGSDQKVEAEKIAYCKRVSPVVGVITGFKVQ